MTATILVLFVLVASGATARRGERTNPARLAWSVGKSGKTPDSSVDLAAEVRYWHAKAAKRLAIAGRFERQRNRARTQLRRMLPPVSYAIHLGAVTYGVSESQMHRVASCESGHDPYASNGQYRGVFQEGPMFERGPFGAAGFSVWDPIANVMTAAYTVSRQGWRQWQCQP